MECHVHTAVRLCLFISLETMCTPNRPILINRFFVVHRVFGDRSCWRPLHWTLDRCGPSNVFFFSVCLCLCVCVAPKPIIDLCKWLLNNAIPSNYYYYLWRWMRLLMRHFDATVADSEFIDQRPPIRLSIPIPCNLWWTAIWQCRPTKRLWLSSAHDVCALRIIINVSECCVSVPQQ